MTKRRKELSDSLNSDDQYCLKIWERDSNRKLHRLFAAMTMFLALCWYLSS